jgi:hypothetical protein
MSNWSGSQLTRLHGELCELVEDLRSDGYFLWLHLCLVLHASNVERVLNDLVFIVGLESCKYGVRKLPVYWPRLLIFIREELQQPLVITDVDSERLHVELSVTWPNSDY